jgi:hypothetical protein
VVSDGRRLFLRVSERMSHFAIWCRRVAVWVNDSAAGSSVEDGAGSVVRNQAVPGGRAREDF